MFRSRSVLRLLIVALVVSMVSISPVPGGSGVALAVTPETRAEVIDGLQRATPEAASDGLARAAGAPDGAASVATEAPIPFSMVGFEAPTAVDLRFRTSEDGSGWGAWQQAEFLDLEDAPDGDEGRDAEDVTRFTDPFWVGEATYLQIEVADADPEEVRAHVIDSQGLSRSLLQRASDVVDAVRNAKPAPVEAEAARPNIITRAQWGADESLRKGKTSYASKLDFAVVHHTAGSNDYTEAQSPAIVRGIYHYHTQTLGWNDVGYNFMVDKYGNVFEGRAGGVDRAVVGAHAGGYNTGSVGVSLLGNYDTAAVTSIGVRRISDVIAWKFDLHLVDPTTKPDDTRVGTRIVGHRDVGQTACPGRNLYAQMGTIRSQVAASTEFRERDLVPLVGDWNGDGRSTPGWFYAGRWMLRNSHSDGPPDVFLTYGQRGDLPVVGDWNGDGRDTIGVVRDNVWLLRYAYRSGADIRMTYGQKGDIPVAGDWNGDGRDTIGVVRDNLWLLRYLYRSGADIRMTYGQKGDKPVAGDWNGNGQDTIGVVRDNEWLLRYEYRSGFDIKMRYGASTDRPVAGDWNGNGQDTLGVERSHRWILRNAYHRPFGDLSYDYSHR